MASKDFWFNLATNIYKSNWSRVIIIMFKYCKLSFPCGSFFLPGNKPTHEHFTLNKQQCYRLDIHCYLLRWYKSCQISMLKNGCLKLWSKLILEHYYKNPDFLIPWSIWNILTLEWNLEISSPFENLCRCIQACKNMVIGPLLVWDKFQDLEKVA